MRQELRRELPEVVSIPIHLVEREQGPLGIARNQGLRELEEVPAIRHAQHLHHTLFGHLALGEADHLVEQRDGVTHAAGCLPREHLQRATFDLHPLFVRESLQVVDDVRLANALEVVALTTRQNRDRNLLWFRRREDELRVGRRLLQGLQQRVEGLGREHVYFVDDVDFVPVAARRVPHRLP